MAILNCSILKNAYWLGDHNEFAVCLSAVGGAIDAACSGRENFRSRTTESLERQPWDLAVPAVSARLVRDELIARSEKRNAAQAEYHRLAASV
ncbi:MULTISPECIES: hypothetical protein [unclassified Bradyrhizobium]|uniref:hypothetical protein n=1 Tax=unclassified Bradyrhizobium TaxID=2631580 RepID=UPI001FFB7C7D|nr:MULTISPECIES: hypothetical protein [unclassified Bradyrhizobium]MCK1707615.1 hypothetical protein [Bradyrhizobium sp. 143]MCK1724826.1 hypothetical protein [Bradyrhizobium sp. 142]